MFTNVDAKSNYDGLHINKANAKNKKNFRSDWGPFVELC